MNAVAPSGHESDSIETLAGTVASCDDSAGSLACDFGRPSYSPDGGTIVVSRQVPIAGRFGHGNQGALMLVGSSGADERTLPRQTSDDEQPAFLASGAEIVFAGRSAANGAVNLFTVRTSGSGLRQLTSGGGSWPAPCANGSIAFVKQGDIYLLSRQRSSPRRVTFRGGTDPSCSPDSRRIAFVRGERLYTIGANGKVLSRVPTPHPASSPAYSPAGHAIAYETDYDIPSADGSISELDVVNLQGRSVLRYPLGEMTGGTMGEDTTQAQAGAIDWQSTGPLPTPTGSLMLVSGSPFTTARGALTCSLAFSPSGKLLITANTRPFPGRSSNCQSFGPGGGSVSVLSVGPTGTLRPVRGSPFATGKRLDTRSVAFSPNGNLVASANTRIVTSRRGSSPVASSISVFSVGRSGALRAVHGSPVSTHSKLPANAVTFSPSGRLLAVTNDAGGVWVFSVGRSGVLRAVRGSPFGTGARHPALTAAFSPGGSLLAISKTDATVPVLAVNPATGALTPVHGSPFELGIAFSLRFSPSGRLLAMADINGLSLFSVDAMSGALTNVFSSPPEDSPVLSPTAVAFSSDGSLLAAPNGGGVAMFSVNRATGALSAVPGLPWLPGSVFSGGTDVPSYSAAFAPGGRRLAVANTRGSVSMFSVR